MEKIQTDDLYMRLEENYEAISRKMADPKIASDAPEYLKLVKDLKEIEPMLMLLRKEGR